MFAECLGNLGVGDAHEACKVDTIGIPSSNSMPMQKQSKSVKDSTPVPIRPLHPGSDVQDLPSTATPSSSHHQPSKLELLLRNQPKYTLLSEAQPPEPAVRQSIETGTGKHPIDVSMVHGMTGLFGQET